VARYFFTISEGSDTIEDESGEVLSTTRDAAVQAAIIASELAEDAECLGYSITVTDEDGSEVIRLPVAMVHAPGVSPTLH
jgi:hypothetical protein